VARSRPKVVWSRLAELDLESAHAYLAERSPGAARQFAADILDALGRIQRHSEIGPPATDLLPEGRYRYVVCGRHRVIYRIAERAVVVLRVWDARRRPEDLIPE